VKQSEDPFRPSSEPARSIYDAFQAEASKRKGRSVDKWVAAELDAVLAASVAAAQRCGLSAPSRDDVVRAELYARGSVDYGAKWAYTLTNRMVRATAA
jgi:hypothetical protein